MVFDYAESNGDNGEVVRRRDGAAGVLDDVVGGPRGVPQWRIQRGAQGVRTPHAFLKVDIVCKGFLADLIHW